jgi:DNA-binding NtrC family response regulator
LKAPNFTDAAMKALSAHDWPGNVRELANAIERLMILYPERSVGAGEVGSVLPRIRAPGPAPSVEAGPLSEMLEGYERQLIQAALDVGNGNIAEAARRLSTDRPNLYRRMKRLGIQRGSSGDEFNDA